MWNLFAVAWLSPFLIVSGTYVAAYAVTMTALSGLLFGIQTDPTATASLIFLPHGIRIIAAWLYGWRAVLYILPGTYLTHAFRMQGVSIDLWILMAPMFGVVCASLCFDLLARLGLDLRFRAEGNTNWRDIIMVGVLASMVNSVGANLFFQNDTYTALAYFVGDVLGMLLLMLCLMWGFRVYRKMRL